MANRYFDQTLLIKDQQKNPIFKEGIYASIYAVEQGGFVHSYSF